MRENCDQLRKLHGHRLRRTAAVPSGAGVTLRVEKKSTQPRPGTSGKVRRLSGHNERGGSPTLYRKRSRPLRLRSSPTHVEVSIRDCESPVHRGGQTLGFYSLLNWNRTGWLVIKSEWLSSIVPRTAAPPVKRYFTMKRRIAASFNSLDLRGNVSSTP